MEYTEELLNDIERLHIESGVTLSEKDEEVISKINKKK